MANEDEELAEALRTAHRWKAEFMTRLEALEANTGRVAALEENAATGEELEASTKEQTRKTEEQARALGDLWEDLDSLATKEDLDEVMKRLDALHGEWEAAKLKDEDPIEKFEREVQAILDRGDSVRLVLAPERIVTDHSRRG